MKQTIALLLSLAVTLLCSCAGPQEALETSSSQQPDRAGRQEGGFGNQRGPGGPEGGGRRVIGRVTAVSGNELELELVEAQRGEMPALDSEDAENGPQPGSGASRGNAPDGQSRPQRGNGGSRPEGEVPRGFGGGFAGEGQSTEYKPTGETLTVTVPVGTPVSAMGRESAGSLTFNSIAKGNIIMVSYAENEAGEEYIESIYVMQAAGS